ncbi:MAG TPA: DoxX family protein [Polyangiaceae bacterium]
MTTLDVPFTASHSHAHRSTPAKASVWVGRILSGISLLFLSWDAIIKLMRHPMAIAASAELGYSERAVVTIGAIAACCVVLYAIPRTAVLGAILWTGYLGGAIATHLRVGNPLFSHTLFPIYVAVLLWGGLALRDPRVLMLLGPIERSRR